jgi:hypothetical protein
MLTITTAQLQPTLTALQSANALLSALILAADTSAPGTTVTGPNSATVTDSQGNTFYLAGPGGGYFIAMVNGSANGAVQSLTVDINGSVWGLCPTVAWFQWTATGWVNRGGTAPVT